MPARLVGGPCATAVATLCICLGHAATSRAEGPTRVLVRPWLAAELVAQGHAELEAVSTEDAGYSILLALGARVIAGPDIAVIEAPNAAVASAIASTLRDSGLYRIAQTDVLLSTASAPDDPYLDQQWSLNAMRVRDAWTTWTGSPGGVVAIVDTGVDLAHADIAPGLLPGYNAVNRLTQHAGGQVMDLNGHGTAVAGAAAARGNNAYGVCGMGWNLSILPVRVSNAASGSAYLSDVVDGVTWAVRNGATVVNVSYEGAWEPIVEILGAWALSEDATLVWAAGNTPMNLNWFDHPSVLVVGGTTDTDARWSNSAYGPAIDIAAPAKSLYLPKLGAKCSYRTGTSFAAAHVSGLIALARSMSPDLSAIEATAALLASARDIGPPGEDNDFGAGIPDAGAMLSLLNGMETLDNMAFRVRADYNGDGSIDILDLMDFLEDFSNENPRADMNRDGAVDVLDFLVFVSIFAG